jgi:hypothetical protein
LLVKTTTYSDFASAPWAHFYTATNMMEVTPQDTTIRTVFFFVIAVLFTKGVPFPSLIMTNNGLIAATKFLGNIFFTPFASFYFFFH